MFLAAAAARAKLLKGENFQLSAKQQASLKRDISAAKVTREKWASPD